MADIFERSVELAEEALQGIEFDLLVFELTLGFIRSGLLLRFIIGDPFQGLFGAGKGFFLDLSAPLKVLGLLSLTLTLLYFRHPVVMLSGHFGQLRMCFLDESSGTCHCGILKLQPVQHDLDTLRRNRSGVQILAQ